MPLPIPGKPVSTNQPNGSNPIDHWLNAAQGALSPNTERALRSDLGIYLSWCQQEDLIPWPARASHLVRFIQAMATTKTPATVRRYLSSLTFLHKAAGWENPVDSVTVRNAMKGIYRSNGRRQNQALGLTLPLRQAMLDATGERLIDVRNRALLAVAYDAMLRRSELVSLQMADFFTEPDGSATVLVRSSKTDPWGVGHFLFLAPDSVAIVREWLQRSGIVDGLLFRSVRKDATIGERLDGSQIPRIYKQMARQAGLDRHIVCGLSGHSARVGAVQDMIASGIELPAILQAGRWKSTAMVNRYGERLLARHSGAAQLALLQRRRQAL